MVIIRPVAQHDLDHLVELAGMASFGLTSLPKDRELLAERIAMSCRTLEQAPKKPGGELYIFVMQDLVNGEIVGMSCIVSKVGGFEPFYAYRVEKLVHESTHLDIRKEISILHLVKEHSGPAEIGGLFLSPAYRRHGNGRLMSLFRFLFMAEHPRRFEPVVIAEMRGVVDGQGHSPFWEALGRHFFDMDFPKADYLSSTDKRFIADLMPTCPIYIPLLPMEAQAVVGQVHPDTRPALSMLIDEGFQFTGMVDIFEAGPIVRCRLQDIRIVKESVTAIVGDISHQSLDSPICIIADVSHEFRACVGRAIMSPAGDAEVDAAAAEALGLHPGDRIRFSPLRPASSTVAPV